MKEEELKRAETNALLDGGRTMLFTVSFSGKEYVLLTREDFEELYGAANTT